MNANLPAIVTLSNAAASISINPFGGAITAFKLAGSDINPLSFAFTKEQMPVNNKDGAPYRGHFACIGRWGEPTAEERSCGIPNHGEPANSLWITEQQSSAIVNMQTVAGKEGLQVCRNIIIDDQQPVFFVNETIKNINSSGRFFNIVQHPTLASPFLNEHTLVDCNAGFGFDQALYKNIAENTILWPKAKDDNLKEIDLRNPESKYNAVFSFVVKEEAEHGWVTAYSPAHNLLIGYIWRRNDYPWIHLWQHFNSDKIQYRGIEFGTAGIHQPFPEILDTATHLFGEKTVCYLDACEVISKKYLAFLHSADSLTTGIQDIRIKDHSLLITPKLGQTIELKLSKNITDGL